MRTIEELQEEMYSIAAKLNAPLPKYEALVNIPTKRPSPDNGIWYEIDNGEYFEHWTEERSYEHSVRALKNENELLYKRTMSLVGRMASSWALARLQPFTDQRRFIFAREIELLGLVNHEWQQSRAEEIKATLARAPYNDPGVMPSVDTEFEQKNSQYLETNKNKDGVVVTEYGAQLEILRSSTGPMPRGDSVITFHLVGTDIDGVEFENSHKRGQAHKHLSLIHI